MKRWTARSCGPAAAAPQGAPTAASDAAAAVGQFLSALSLLQNIPLNHLIPYSQMLPAESIQFFNIDPNWMQALYQGVMSLGASQAPNIITVPALPGAGGPCFGFLLNSALVSNWPTLTISGTVGSGSSAVTVAPIALETLAPTLLLAIFTQSCDQIVLTQPHEGLVLGVDIGEGNPPGYSITLVYPVGASAGIPTQNPVVTAAVEIAAQPTAQQPYTQIDMAKTFSNVSAGSQSIQLPQQQPAAPAIPNPLPANMWGLELIQRPAQVTIMIQTVPPTGSGVSVT